MKVLVNVLSAVAGGSITYLRNIAAPLAAAFAAHDGHELHFLIHRSQLGLIPEIPTAKMHIVEGTMPRSYARLWWERRHIAKHLRGIDVYFVPYQVGWSPPSVRTVLMLRNMEPFFHWNYPYNLVPRVRLVVLHRMMRRQLRRAQRVIAVSDFARAHLTDDIGVPRSRSVTVRHGCDDLYRGAPVPADRAVLEGMGIGADYIFTPGSLLPYRRFEDVVAAFARIAPAHPALQLVTSGLALNGPYIAKVQEVIAQSGCGERIHVVGNVPPQTMAVLYRNARLFASASEIEACPNTIIEALASGCAMVAPRLQPNPEFIGDAGRYFTTRDTGSLVEAVSGLLRDEALRMRLQDAARQASAGFTWERCALETFQALTRW